MVRFVAVPLIAAICLGSPPLVGTSSADQMVKGGGARARGERRGGDQRRDNGGARTAGRRDDGDRNRPATRGDRGDQRVAVPRDRDHERDTGPRYIVRDRPNVNINIGSYPGPRYYAPAYYDRWARSYYRWSPLGFVPWSLIYAGGFPNIGFYTPFGPAPSYYGNYGYGYYNYGPAYPPPYQISGYDIGAVRLKIRPRDAQVFVDGYYAGLVDDFDGTFQSLRLDGGGHKIAIRMPGYEDLELDVHVQPGRTITLQEDLRPRP